MDFARLVHILLKMVLNELLLQRLPGATHVAIYQSHSHRSAGGAIGAIMVAEPKLPIAGLTIVLSVLLATAYGIILVAPNAMFTLCSWGSVQGLAVASDWYYWLTILRSHPYLELFSVIDQSPTLACLPFFISGLLRIFQTLHLHFNFSLSLF